VLSSSARVAAMQYILMKSLKKAVFSQTTPKLFIVHAVFACLLPTDIGNQSCQLAVNL